MKPIHTTNPNIRPAEQNIPREKDDFNTTPPFPRAFKTAFAPDFLADYHKGVMAYTYKGVSCLKSPIDLAIYMLMFQELRPRTIVEIGSFHGGAALFYADIAKCFGLDTQIITVDFRDLQDRPGDTATAAVEFIQADAMQLEKSALPERLARANRPILAIEDSAHTFAVTYQVMRYFADTLRSGEYLIIEDGVIEDQGANWNYDGGPNRAVNQFFLDHPQQYELDERYCDFFGRNATFNPNGYLKKR
jgi:cephalosporin hydroxylase